MAFNVSKFRSAFSGAKQDYIIAPSNYFEVQFMDVPAALNDHLKDNSQMQHILANDAFNNMRFRCHHADIPGKMISPMTRGGFMGPNRQMPIGAMFSPLQLDFLETPRFNIRAFFDLWTTVCEGNYGSAYVNEYYDDLIMKEIVIIMYTRDGKKVAKWTLSDCWPSSLTHSSISWDAVNSSVTVGVEIMFYRWDSEWYDIKKNDCSFDDGPDEVINAPTTTAAHTVITPEVKQPDAPWVAETPAQPKQQILRNEWGEPYILEGEQGDRKLSGVDTKKYENQVINTDTWHGKNSPAPTNKI